MARKGGRRFATPGKTGLMREKEREMREMEREADDGVPPLFFQFLRQNLGMFSASQPDAKFSSLSFSLSGYLSISRTCEKGGGRETAKLTEILGTYAGFLTSYRA